MKNHRGVAFEFAYGTERIKYGLDGQNPFLSGRHERNNRSVYFAVARVSVIKIVYVRFSTRRRRPIIFRRNLDLTVSTPRKLTAGTHPTARKSRSMSETDLRPTRRIYYPTEIREKQFYPNI